MVGVRVRVRVRARVRERHAAGTLIRTRILTVSRQPSFGTDAASALVALSAIGAAAATEQQWLAAPPTADAATRSEGGEEADTRSEGGEEAEARRADLVSYQTLTPAP